MTDKWDGMFEADDLPGLFTNVEQAKRLGKERFCNVAMETAFTALGSDDVNALIVALIVGNIAFDAKPECSIGLTDKHRLLIQIVEEA